MVFPQVRDRSISRCSAIIMLTAARFSPYFVQSIHPFFLFTGHLFDGEREPVCC